MKKNTTFMKSALSFCTIMLALSAQAQFTETMGTTGPATQTVTARQTAGLFSVTTLTYSGLNSDARTTTPSHTGTGGYVGASGLYNILLQPGNETFEIHTIDASRCSGATISFGVNKNTNASTGSELLLQYSVNGGTSWTNIPFTALPTGTGTSGTTWYLRSVALPAGAVSSTLWLRFINTQAGTSASNPQFRIDDVSMSCGATVDCGTFETSIAVFGDLVFCEGTSLADIVVTTDLPSPTYTWYDGNGNVIPGQTSDQLETEVQGTFYVVVSDANGCSYTSARTHVQTYPAPQVCNPSISGCVGDTVLYCPQLRTADLIISQYMEGSGFNKCIELYNGTCETLQSGNYELAMYVNGSTTPVIIPTNSPDFAILPGTTYTICHDQAAYTGANKYTSLLQHNGNESFVLTNTAANVVVDIFGSVGFNPGSSWHDTNGVSTEDLTLVRKSCIYSGVISNPALPGVLGFPTLFTEWDTLPKNDTTGFGSHVFTGAPYSFSITGTSSTFGATSSCVNVIIGAGTSTLEVTPTLCSFNNCGPIAVTVTEDCRGDKRSSAAPMTTGAKNLQVFPNPTADQTVIAFDLANDGAVMVTLTDLSGHVVLTKSIQATAGAQRIELNLSELSAGTYVANVASANGLETVRIVKMK